MRFFLTSRSTAAKFASPEVKTAMVVRTLTAAIVGVILAGGILLALFFYKHVYLTISFSEEILLLKSQFGLNTIDFGTFEKMRTWWEERNRRAAPPVLKRDPFAEGF